MVNVPKPAGSVPEFHHQVGPVLQHLKTAIANVIGKIPAGEPIGRPTDLQRALGIRTTLAWRVFRLAFSMEPLVQGTAIPGGPALKRFLKAAASHGVPESVLNSAGLAVDQFDTFVKEHAPDRSAFASMISGLNRSGSEQVDLQVRRAAFRANTHIWGLQAKTQLSCFIFRQSTTSSKRLDVMGIRGKIGLKRFRDNVSCVTSRVQMADDSGQEFRPTPPIPIDFDEDSPEISLLREFCTQPLPKFRKTRSEDGRMTFELSPISLGNKSAITYLLGDIYPALHPSFPDDEDWIQQTTSVVRTPCAVLLHDVLMHEGLFDSSPPKVRIYGDQNRGDADDDRRDEDLLAMNQSVKHLGRGLSVLNSPDVPRYAEMVKYAMDKAGWDPEKFNVYRCRVEFPVMPSSTYVQFELPK